MDPSLEFDQEGDRHIETFKLKQDRIEPDLRSWI